MVGRYLVV
jgi:serine/threonine-protein kinase SRPK3